MSDIKISQLPVVPNNTFNTIFPNVQGGETNQIALSGFNTNDFTNVVNLGTGNTASVLTMDCSLGDVFVFTASGMTSDQTWTAQTINAVVGKTYKVIWQNKDNNDIATLTNNTNSQSITVVSANRWMVGEFIVLNNYILCPSSTSNTFITGNFPY